MTLKRLGIEKSQSKEHLVLPKYYDWSGPVGAKGGKEQGACLPMKTIVNACLERVIQGIREGPSDVVYSVL